MRLRKENGPYETGEGKHKQVKKERLQKSSQRKRIFRKGEEEPDLISDNVHTYYTQSKQYMVTLKIIRTEGETVQVLVKVPFTTWKVKTMESKIMTEVIYYL